MEFISGMFSGLVQNIIGHPFDTIKVLQQNGKSPFLKNSAPFSRKYFTFAIESFLLLVERTL